ncbi:MAG: amidase family protein, partial [Bacillota bacterium]
MNLTFASFGEIAEAVQTKKISAKEVVRHFQNRIQLLNEDLNAFTSLNPQAIQEAELIDVRIAKGEKVGSLAGVPFGIKEMLCTKGIATTAGSKMLSNFVPPYDATV